jgi:hypothetical protein
VEADGLAVSDDPREAVRLLGLLAEPDRLAVVAALALGATTLKQVRAATGLGVRAAGSAMTRLVAGELVRKVGSGYELVADTIKDAAAAAAPSPDSDDHWRRDPSEASVLRTFLRDGRIVSIPAQASKRRVLLEHVVTVFEIGHRYPEKEVNTMIRAFYDDYALLRRALIDADLLSRDHNVYWRSGGPVEL